MWFFFFILLAIGLLNTISPETAWDLEYGWKFEDATPSDAALALNRLVGILCLVICTGMLLWGVGGCVSSTLAEKYFKGNMTEKKIDSILLEGKANNLRFYFQLSDDEVHKFLETIQHCSLSSESITDYSYDYGFSSYEYIDNNISLSNTSISITLKNKDQITIFVDYFNPSEFIVTFTNKSKVLKLTDYELTPFIIDLAKNNSDKLPIKKDTSTNNSTDSTNTEENEEYKNYTGFYGEWKVDWYVTTENNADKDLIKTMEDTIFIFDADILKVNDESYNSVTYSLKKATRNSIKIPLNQCGITTEEFIEAHATQNGIDLSVPGSTFFVVDNDNIIIEHKGIYFMAIRN